MAVTPNFPLILSNLGESPGARKERSLGILTPFTTISQLRAAVRRQSCNLCLAAPRVWMRPPTPPSIDASFGLSSELLCSKGKRVTQRNSLISNMPCIPCWQIRRATAKFLSHRDVISQFSCVTDMRPVRDNQTSEFE